MPRSRCDVCATLLWASRSASTVYGMKTTASNFLSLIHRLTNYREARHIEA